MPTPSSPASPRTARMLPGLVLLPTVLLAVVSRLVAGPVHAPFAPYSVQVGAASTMFNSAVGFNGNRADFGTSWGSVWVQAQQNYSTGWQTFTATFQTDPGHVFTSATLGFGQWSFAVPEGGWLWFEMNWTLPGSTYAGTNNLDDTYFTSPGGASWAVGPGQGNYQWWHKSNQGGGGMEFMPIMYFGVPLSLGNVSSFSVSLSARIQHGGNVFGSGTGAGIGFSAFQVTANTTPGTPAPAAVPDSAATAVLLGTSLLGLVGTGRNMRRRRRLSSP